MSKPSETAYRYEARAYASIDQFGEAVPGPLRIVRYEWPVVKHTPCGFWIELPFGGKRFVRGGAKRQYAHLTKKLAIESYRKRRECYKAILEARLREVEHSLALIEWENVD